MAVTYKNPHEDSYRAAQAELAQLGSERVEITDRLGWIETRMSSLNEFLKAIVPLIEQEPGKALVDAGLTQICRDVLDKAGRWVTAPEFREMLSRIGIDMSGYTNPGAVLHAILKRIAAVREDNRGKLYAINDDVPFGDSTFEWIDSIEDEDEVDVETVETPKDNSFESSFE
jgi:hypothetical protein